MFSYLIIITNTKITLNSKLESFGKICNKNINKKILIQIVSFLNFTYFYILYLLTNELLLNKIFSILNISYILLKREY